MDSSKATATHIWTAAEDIGFLKQLTYYKKIKSKWFVYSDVTGWRPSQNNLYWFKEETELGFFRQLTQEEKRELTKRNR